MNEEEKSQRFTIAPMVPHLFRIVDNEDRSKSPDAWFYKTDAQNLCDHLNALYKKEKKSKEDK